MLSETTQVSENSTKNLLAVKFVEAHDWVYMTRRVLSRLLIAEVIYFLSIGISVGQSSEQTEQQQKMPVATQWTLEAAGPVQKTEINAVMLLVCSQSEMKGTGFLIDKGLVVTTIMLSRDVAQSR